MIQIRLPIIWILTTLWFLPIISAGFTEFIGADTKIQIETLADRCLSAIKPGLNEPYKYVVTTYCDLDTHHNSLTWEAIEEHQENGFDYFKIKSIHDSRTGKSTKCIGFINENPKAILVDCDEQEGRVQFFRVADGQVISKPKANTLTERCLIIEDLDFPTNTTMAVKGKKCVDKLKYRNPGEIEEYQLQGTRSRFPVINLVKPKKSYASIKTDTYNTEETTVEFIIRSDDRFAVKEDGQDPESDDATCLTGKLRKKNGAISKKMLFKKCIIRNVEDNTENTLESADKWYIDDNTKDGDREIHMINRKTGLIRWKDCLGVARVPKVNRHGEVKERYRVMFSPCQRGIGTFTEHSYLGNPNLENYLDEE